MKTQLDHLVIGAGTLQQGVEYVRSILGVEIPYGGFHQKMGTHNHLMQLADDIFLEVIAINPGLELPPLQPRWYGLGDPFVRQRIQGQPTLLGWVVNTRDIYDLIKRATFSLGKAELISRGNLSWYFSLPEDGRLLAGGMLPYAIEWQVETHPARHMADLGCQLETLEIAHPHADWLQSKLESIEARELVTIKPLGNSERPRMAAHIRLPDGSVRVLSSV